MLTKIQGYNDKKLAFIYYTFLHLDINNQRLSETLILIADIKKHNIFREVQCAS